MAEASSRAEALVAGAKTYVNGEACPNGHMGHRRTDNGGCVECQRANARKWKSKNRAAINAYDRRWKAKSPKKAEMYAANGEWRRNNREKMRQYSKRYSDNNPERCAASRKRWYENNPHKNSLYKQVRRARERGASGSHMIEQLTALFDKQNGKCPYCFVSLKKVGKHLDHVVSLKKGGTNDISNLQWTCPTCNQRKRDSDPLEFARKLGRLV